MPGRMLASFRDANVCQGRGAIPHESVASVYFTFISAAC